MEKQKKIIFFSNEKEEKEKKEKRWMLEAIAHSCNPLLFPPKEAGEGKVRANTLEVDRRATASCCLASNQDGRASRCLIWSALYARCLFDCHSIVWSITYSLFFFGASLFFLSDWSVWSDLQISYWICWPLLQDLKRRGENSCPAQQVEKDQEALSWWRDSYSATEWPFCPAFASDDV